MILGMKTYVSYYCKITLKLVCVTDQDTLTYPNLCGLFKSLAPEILSVYLDSA